MLCFNIIQMRQVPLSFLVPTGSVSPAALRMAHCFLWLCSWGPIDCVMLRVYALSQDRAGITTYISWYAWETTSQVCPPTAISEMANSQQCSWLICDRGNRYDHFMLLFDIWIKILWFWEYLDWLSTQQNGLLESIKQITWVQQELLD